MLLDPEFQELLACISGLPNVTQGPAPVLWQNSSGQLGNADTSSLPSSSTSVDRDDGNMLFDTDPSFSSGLALGIDNMASTGLYQVQHNGTDMNHRMPSLTTTPPSPSPHLSYAHTYNSVDTDSSDLNAPFQLPNQSVFPSTFGATPMPPLSVLPPASATSFLGMRSPIQERGMHHQAHQTSMEWHTEALYQVRHNGTEVGHHTPSLTTSDPSPSSHLSNTHTYNSVDIDSPNTPFQLPNQSVSPSTLDSMPMPPLPVFSPVSTTTPFLGMRPPIQQGEMHRQAHQTSMGWNTDPSGPQTPYGLQSQGHHDAHEAISSSNQACPTSLGASNTPISAEPPYLLASSYQDDTRPAPHQFPYEIPASWTQTETGYTDEYDAYHEEALTPQYYNSRPTIGTIPPPSSSQNGAAFSANIGPYHVGVTAPQYTNVHAPHQAHGHAIDHDARENADCSAFRQGRLEQPHNYTFDQPSKADDYDSSKDLLVKLYEILGQLLGRSTPAKGGDKLIQPSQSNYTEVGHRDAFVSMRASQHEVETPTARTKSTANHRGTQLSSKTSPRHHPYQPTQQRGRSDPASATSQRASKQPKSTPSSSASQDAGRPHSSKKRNEKKGPQESEAPRTQMLVRPEDHKAMVPKPSKIDDIWTKYEFGPAEKKDPLKFKPYHGPVAKGKRSEK